MEQSPLHVVVICILQGVWGIIYSEERGGMKNCCLGAAVFLSGTPVIAGVGFLDAVGVRNPQMRLEFVLCSGDKLRNVWK